MHSGQNRSRLPAPLAAALPASAPVKPTVALETRQDRRSAAARTSRGVALLASDGGVPCQDLGHGVAGAGERRAHESGDQVAGGRRDQGLRPVVARQSPPQWGPVGGQIGEARVAGAAHDQHFATGHPGEEPVAPLQIAREGITNWGR
jgi:hypothetical protein